MALMHDWVREVVAEVPPHCDEENKSQSYYFRNAYTSAIACVHLTPNQMVFESQSASTIAIFKEGITALANLRRVQVDEYLSANEDSMFDFLQLLRPHVEHLLQLAQKDIVTDAIQELVHAEQGGQTGDGNIPPWLTPHYAEIYRSNKQIKFDLKHRQKKLEYISGIITDLHVDWHKLKGVDARQGLPRVAAAINAGDFNGIVYAIMGTATRPQSTALQKTSSAFKGNGKDSTTIMREEKYGEAADTDAYAHK
jgi:hypothetical protein